MSDACIPQHGAVEDTHIDEALRVIHSEFSVSMGSAERVEAACRQLRDSSSQTGNGLLDPRIVQLPQLLGRRSGALAEKLISCIEDLAAKARDPWPLLDGMLGARDRALVARALRIVAQLARNLSLHVDDRVIRRVAAAVETNEHLRADADVLALASDIMRHSTHTDAVHDADPVTSTFLSNAPAPTRRLAARILDTRNDSAPPELARRLLGDEAFTILGKYLTFTRATHLDLLDIAPRAGAAMPALRSFKQAEDACGESLLRRIIGELGWSRVCHGIQVERLVGLSIADSFPYTMRPEEAELFDDRSDVTRVFDRYLVFAHGGTSSEDDASPDDDMIALFRAYNLRHAEALAEIADISPLSAAKVHRILDLLTQLVADFVVLFGHEEPECARLPERFTELKVAVLAELKRQTAAAPLSAELTRLVQMFEDPTRLDDVRTLHGLKRYLHQKGLRLAFKLFESGQSTNRTVDLLVASEDRILRKTSPIAYIDFEPDPPDRRTSSPAIPYAVSVVATGFGRQFLHGHESIPKVDIFRYGNEVHYYLRYRNHPAFLRIDYSPPLRGGMIDLEYFGVSKYELSQHPNLELHAIRQFFRAMDFDVRIENTRIHARYDKERAVELSELCEKAEILLCLVPYMMDVDWIIGNLSLNEQARQKTAVAWAQFLPRWLVLPVPQLLTPDRQGIAVASDAELTIEDVPRWSGQGAYTDRFSIGPPPGLLDGLRETLRRRGLQCVELPTGHDTTLHGQARMEKRLLLPLRQALARGEILRTSSGLGPSPKSLFDRDHEARRFAQLLSAGGEELRHAAQMAALARTLERNLRFQTTGSINGYLVQQTRLVAGHDTLRLYVLRDGAGIIRLAYYAAGEGTHRSRSHVTQHWRDSAGADPRQLAILLRRANYIATDDFAAGPAEALTHSAIMRHFLTPNPSAASAPTSGQRIVQGLPASPGRAVGRALFGTTGRSPADFEGAVLFAASVRPEDNTFLRRAAGIVSTGGGVLSHAGLLAVQFNKPAMIIPATWQLAKDGGVRLAYRRTDYEEESAQVGLYAVTMRHNVREPVDYILEGDMVVLDVGAATLRVLGADHNVLAFQNGIRQLGDVGRRLANPRNEGELLVLRGRRLHARRQMEKLLDRIRSPELARHAVHELLLGDALLDMHGPSAEKSRLLTILLQNETVAADVRACLTEVADDLRKRLDARRAEGLALIPTAIDPYEVLSVRLGILHLYMTQHGIASALADCGVPSLPPDETLVDELDRMAVRRLNALRNRAVFALPDDPTRPARPCELRHAIRRADRLRGLLGEEETSHAYLYRLRRRLADADSASLRRCEHRRVITAVDGGLELHPLIGWKAANLAELAQFGEGGLVPPWFAVTDRAFREVLDAPCSASGSAFRGKNDTKMTLGEAISDVLAQSNLTDTEKSAHIARLWKSATVPEPLVRELFEAYRNLAAAESTRSTAMEDSTAPFVAVRSSGREEDTEAAARAGEFETYLFVRGEAALLEHLKLAWSGLWTERAIHNRRSMGAAPTDTGGGVLIQRIVWSRVAGVAQTVNLAEARLREMVINAGLGMGAGIVSGVVAADQIIVAKSENLATAPPQFRYVTSDKRQQVVFNAKAGSGTVVAETLYHQRLRPALEYVELCELARAAARLEAAYGYPLDIEFGIEEQHLRLLQIRPVANFGAVMAETAGRFPLHHPVPRESTAPRAEEKSS